MKPQDIIFLITTILLFVFKKNYYFIYAGLTCLILAIPLFVFWVFFTAERLTWYAAGFFFIYLLFSLKILHKVQ